ncbi:MAG: restriction endonuclease subunit S [Acidobacteria bacterium]|nr:restriction endonuclease subunit S [Acidobacteriota bacterium]
MGELVRLERRPVDVIPDEQYAEIGLYCFGRGIFHKAPRTGAEVGDKDLYLIKEGDFILQITFAWEGAVGLVSKSEDGMYGSVRFPTFRVDESQCYPPYLFTYFKTKEGVEQLGKISPGSADRNRVLSLKRIPEVVVPLPSLEEQHRIVAWIEELAAKIEEARGLRREVTEESEALLRSIIFNASTTPTAMKDLVMLKEPDVIVQRDQVYQFAGVYSFGRGVFKGPVKMGLDFAYPRLSKLTAGNFVYPKLMAWEGALGVVPPECDGLVVSTEFPVFEIDETKVLPDVIDIYFRSPSVWPLISGESTGTNVRRRRLNPSNFLNFRMPLPPMSAQQRLRQVKAKIDAIKDIRAETAAELDALLPSVLDRAFRGEL